MSAFVQGFKATAIGGILFLIPLTVTVLVMVQLVGLLAAVTVPIADALGASSLLGGTAANLIALLLIALVCYGVGLVAASRMGQRFVQTVESTLLSVIPGYTILRGFVDTLVGSEEAATRFQTVMVDQGFGRRLGYEVERTPKGWVVVFLPGSPNPWAGEVVYFDPKDVEPVEMPVQEMPRIMQQMGIGSRVYGDADA
jgi:uncharacterized membrane protein